MPATYVTTTLPYVNARPHIGHALELVQADVLARYHRGRGDAVRFQAGTDDNSLKNVLAAEAAGAGVREFVDRNAEAFLALGGALSLTVDDFIRTSRDPRHRPGVEAFWRACAGDLYRRRYAGLYCTGCEQFYTPAELRGSSPGASTRAAAPSTGPSRSRSARRTGSSGCPGTPRRCGRRSPPGGCASSRPGAATRSSRSSTAAWPTSRCRGPRRGPAGGASRCPATRGRSSTCGSTPCATT